MSSESLITFYILVLIIIYTLKQGIDVFFLTNYNRKICLLISFGVNLFFFLSYVTLEPYEGIFDQSIKQVTHDYRKHLEIIFNRKFPIINDKFMLGCIFFINFFVIVAILPAIIKFGNWYGKTLKELYY